jgi:hypothetical protein
MEVEGMADIPARPRQEERDGGWLTMALVLFFLIAIIMLGVFVAVLSYATAQTVDNPLITGTVPR